MAIPEEPNQADDPPASGTLTGGTLLERSWSTWWWLVLAGFFVLTAGLVTRDVFGLIARPLGLFVLSLTLAFALAPIATRMERVMPRAAAIAIIYLLILAIIIGLGFLIFPPLIEEASRISDQAPEYIERLRDFIPGGRQVSTENLVNTLGSEIGSLGSALVEIPVQVMTYVLEVFLLLIISAYLLIEGSKIIDFILSLFPVERREEVKRLILDMGDAMGGFIRGTLISMLIVGILVYIGLLFLGVNFPLLLAVQAGLLEFIPNIGPYISAIPIGLVALVESPTKALLAVGYLTLIQQIEGYLIIPYVMRSQTKISPLMVILALLIGGGLGGVLGVLIVIPLTAALRIFVLRVAAPTVRRWMGAQSPASERRHERS